MSLSNKALLVNLSISQWVGRRIDRTATNTVEVSHKTQSRVGNYTKKLLPGAKELDDIQNMAQNIRKWFHSQTLPWMTDGSRILKNSNFFDFTETWRQKENEYIEAVKTFFQAYPRLREEAKIKLGDLFQEGDYPSEVSLTNSFNCHLAFVPFPDVSDFRVELSEYEKKSFLENMHKVENEAIQECWTRLKEVVSKASDKLSDPSAIFRDSLIENIQEMCHLLPKLNVTDDTNLESMRREVERLVINISPERCRENVTARSDAATKLAEINSKMSAFMQ